MHTSSTGVGSSLRSSRGWKTGSAIGIAVVVVTLVALRTLESKSASELAPPYIEDTKANWASPSLPVIAHADRSAAVPPRDHAIVGVVRNRAGSTLSGVTVCALGRRPDTCCEVTGPTGLFELHAKGAEVTDLLATAPGYLPRQHSLAEYDGRSRRDSSMEITLELGGSVIAGSVVDVSGGPISGAVVRLNSTEGQTVSAIVMSGADGRFTAHVPEGNFDVIARAEAYSQTAHRVRSPAIGITLALSPGAVIEGIVLSRDTDEPLADVRVSVKAVHDPLDLLSLTRTRADGTFSVDGLSGGGEFHVQASSATGRGTVQSVTVDVGQTSEFLVLRMFAGTSLIGHVTSATGTCPDASVTVIGPSSTTARASPDGLVRLDGLLPGRYEVVVRCPLALSHHEVIDVGHEPLTRLWPLTGGLSVSGRVEDLHGEPMGNAIVNVSPRDLSEEPSVSCSSGPNGEFLCSGLSTGDYDCSLSDGTQVDVVRVSLQQDSVASILLRARSFGTIYARVVQSAHGSANELGVFARLAGGFPVQSVPHSSGFVFERMPLGRYEVYVNLPTANGHPTEAVLQHQGQIIELDLDAPLSLSIEGQVLDESGAPWIDAWVTARPVDALARTSTSTDRPTLTDERGEFVLRALTAGQYDLQVQGVSGTGSLKAVKAGSSDVVIRKSPPIASTVSSAAP